MTATSLEGRLAIVTGGNRGIGRGIATVLAEAGADVAIIYRRQADAADEVVKAIKDLGRTAGAYQASVDSTEEVDVAVDRILNDFGKVDILVNNAGIASRGNDVADTSTDELTHVLGVHVLGPFHLCGRVLPSMREQGRGDIVMISSIATISPAVGGAPYMMAKAALESLAWTLAVEEAKNGIRVNVVAPGLVVSDMGDRLARARVGVDAAAELDERYPFGRVTRPEDVGEAVRYFVSSGAAMVTGQRVFVHGGVPDVLGG